MEYYPTEFSPEARAAVEADMIRSWRRHLTERTGRDRGFDEESSLRTCILSVFFAYAREAIKLGEQKVWAVDKVRVEALDGLRRITIELTFRKGGRFRSWTDNWGGNIIESVRREFENATEWHQFEDELLALADSRRQSGSETARPVNLAIDLFLSDSQKELLSLLVSQDKLRGGEEFIFTQDNVSAGITYPGFSVNVPYTKSDFLQLRTLGLITFGPTSTNAWLGQLLRRGIAAARNAVTNAAPERTKPVELKAQQEGSRIVATVGTESSLPGESPETSREPQVTEWEEVEIRFLSDERIQIIVGRFTETQNYAEFGFEDGRSKAPNLAWITLRLLATMGGKIRQAADGQDWSTMEKRMQEIRKALKKRFHLAVDPLPFVEGVGYQARFKLGCAPSFDS